MDARVQIVPKSFNVSIFVFNALDRARKIRESPPFCSINRAFMPIEGDPNY